MAVHEGRYGNKDGPERDGYEFNESEFGSGAGEEYDSGRPSPKMPPRNILETDSAKYTAEYIKEVVKGLYTVDTEAYPSAQDEFDGHGDASADFPEDNDLSEETNNIENKHGGKSVAASSYATEPRVSAGQPGERTETRAEYPDAGRSVKRQDRHAEKSLERSVEKSMEGRQESAERPAGWKPEWKTEKLDGRNPERHEFDTERNFRLGKKRAESRFSDMKPSDSDSARAPEREERRDVRERLRENPAQTVKNSLTDEQEEAFTPNDFLKSFERKAQGENINYNPRPRERKTFSSLRADGNTAELENALSGRPSRKNASEKTDKPERFTRERAPQPEREMTDIEPEEEYVYIRQTSGYPAIEPAEPREAEEKRSDVGEEKVPIIISRNIEGRGMKTADDYRNVSRSNYDKPLKRMEPVDINRKGANIFAALMLIAVIAIIGVLVWRVVAMSNELKTVQDNSDEVVRLRGQVSSLSQTTKEQSDEVIELNGRIKELEDENIRLSAIIREEQEPPEPEAESPSGSAEAPPSGLNNGYYTVKSGDTLWTISKMFLGSGEEYMKIATANNIDPSLPLYAGLELKIPNQ